MSLVERLISHMSLFMRKRAPQWTGLGGTGKHSHDVGLATDVETKIFHADLQLY